MRPSSQLSAIRPRINAPTFQVEVVSPRIITNLVGRQGNGVQLINSATIELIFEEQANGIGEVLFIPLRFGIGFGLPKPESVPAIPDEKVCFWGGWGGSMVVINPDPRTTFAYVMNNMGEGLVRSHPTVRPIYDALG